MRLQNEKEQCSRAKAVYPDTKKIRYVAPYSYACVVKRDEGQENDITHYTLTQCSEFYPFQSLEAANNAVTETTGRQVGGRAERNG